MQNQDNLNPKFEKKEKKVVEEWNIVSSPNINILYIMDFLLVNDEEREWIFREYTEDIEKLLEGKKI